MDKISKSFRIPKETNEQLKELAGLLKETDTQVLVRAVGRLYADRAQVLDEDIAARKTKARS